MPLRGRPHRSAGRAEVGGVVQLQPVPQDRDTDGLLPRRGPGEWGRADRGRDGGLRVGRPDDLHHHCPNCGCFTDWRSTGESYGKVSVNARLLDGFGIRDGRVQFDGRELDMRYMDNAGAGLP